MGHSLDKTPHFELHCPKDGAEMEKVNANGITLDRCVSCGAMWFDANELERLRKDARSADKLDVGRTSSGAKAAPAAGARATRGTKTQCCPRCEEVMVEHEYPDQSHIMIMTCKRCGGHLLDAGEFVDVTKYSLAERLKSFFS
jgi:Zn-finger nucleic acid-binding protein